MDLKGAVVLRKHNDDAWVCGNISKMDGSVEVTWNSGKVEGFSDNADDLFVSDLGPTAVCHQHVTCDACLTNNITGIRWKCNICDDYDLCSICYHSNKHTLDHAFKRIDVPNISPVLCTERKNSIRVKIFGFFDKARVKRGKDWEWGNQDGGTGNLGTVIKSYDWNGPFSTRAVRSGVSVKWDSSKNTNNYRIGFQGKVDLLCVNHSFGGLIYKTHLATTKMLLRSSLKKTEKKLNVGDTVVTCKTLEALAELQEDHGGFTKDMLNCVGIVGTVAELIRDNAVVVFDTELQPRRDMLMMLLELTSSRRRKWVFNAAVLQKVETFQNGDKVKVLDDTDTLKLMQINVKVYKPIQDQLCGKEGVIEERRANVAMVKFGGQHIFPMSYGLLRKKNEEVTGDELLGLLLEGFVRAVIDEKREKEDKGQQQEQRSLLQSQQQQQQQQLQSQQQGAVAKEKKTDDLRTLVNANDCEGVKKLLEDRPYMVNTFQYGSTSLHVAVFKNFSEMVDVLLECHADVSIQDDNGDTALHVAASKNFVSIGKKLIKKSSPKDKTNKSDLTALTIATIKSHDEFVSMLVRNNCATDLPDPNGNIPLHTACSEGNDGLVDILLNEIDVAATNRDGLSGIYLAIAKGHLDVVRLISNNYPEVLNIEKLDGSIPLHFAARNGQEEIVEQLLRVSARKKFNIDKLSKTNQTPLHVACYEGYLSVVRLLLNHGASINAEGYNGNTALHLCVAKHQLLFNLPQELQVHELRPDLKTVRSHFANRSTSGIVIACYLVENGAPLEYLNHEGKSALDVCNDTTLTKLLCEFGKKHRALQSPSPTSGVHSSNKEPFLKKQESELDFDPCPLCERRTPVEGRFQPCGHAMFCYEHADTFKSCPACKTHIKELTSLSIERLPNCIVCRDIRVNITFQPCGHQLVCYECSKRFKVCLKCEQPINAKVPTGDFKPVHLPTPSVHPSTSDVGAATAATTIGDEQNEQNMCNICFERPRNMVFQCGHNTCKVCAYALRECHICRIEITQRILMYDN